MARCGSRGLVAGVNVPALCVCRDGVPEGVRDAALADIPLLPLLDS